MEPAQMKQGELFHLLLEASPVPHFAVDRERTLVYANQAFHKLGVRLASSIQADSVWKGPTFEELKETCSRLLSEKTAGKEEFGFLEQGHFAELHYEYSDPYLLVAVVDVTEYRKRQDDLLAQMLASQQLFEKLASANTKANESAQTDPLTGLNNRRRADELVTSVFPALVERGLPISLVTLDVDHFKKFNDTYGHLEGDNVLKLVAQALREFVDEAETPARVGGEEFLVICPNQTAEQATARANVLLEKIRAITGAPSQITASLGVACASAIDKDWLDVLHRADVAMYAAKGAGRNQVQMWNEEMGGNESQSHVA